MLIKVEFSLNLSKDLYIKIERAENILENQSTRIFLILIRLPGKN